MVPRYYTLRSDGYRLIFTASIAGAILLLAAAVLIEAVDTYRFAQKIDSVWDRYVHNAKDKPIDGSGVATLAFLMGAVVWWPLNLLGKLIPWFSDKKAVDRAIRRKQDPLEMLLRRALGSGKLVAITVANGKVYVGLRTNQLQPRISNGIGKPNP